MGKVVRLLVVLVPIGLAAFWFLTTPKTIDVSLIDGITPDIEQGAAVFTAAGCASCHSAPDADDDTHLHLTGGRAFPSDFGTFYAPNISPDPVHGIGDWQVQDLVNAMHFGTSPEGQHYFPAFPYTTYTRAELPDIVSLFAYLQTLPAVQTPSKTHDVGFPFNIRRTLGGWKLLFMREGWIVETAATPELERGRYLVEALAHCGECHTPRNALGGMQTDKWLTGAANPSGQGRIPGITPAELDWSASDTASYLTTGFTPEFDVVGGHMVEVVKNLAKMPTDDVTAIVAYIQSLKGE